ncbi:glutathione-disulfide reductase [Geminicoccaceae bacterium 1502E]|nr:glutathione-disulfide reductase [Geminicoccaceae bacterium 1502E]
MADYDLFVIGGGSGGVACARRAASHGARVAVAEHSRLGGTCVIRGCVPKKLMHYGAHFADMFKVARAYGWDLDEPQLDFERLARARNKEITRLNGIYIAMMEKAGVTVIDGKATIAGRSGDDFIVEVAGRQVSARRVLVAVGASPVLPKMPGIDHVVSSDFVLEEVFPQPERLVVVGAGYIGLELASIFSWLGTDTTVVLRADLPLRGFDEDLRHDLAAQLQLGGLKLKPHAMTECVEKTAHGLVVQTSDGPVEGDMVLFATGRDPMPSTRGLGLESLGVGMNKRGAIHVDEAYESSVPGLYAVGDCSDHAGHAFNASIHDLTPIAIAEGRVVAEALFNDNPHKVFYETTPTAIFSLPQAGAIGLTERDARARGLDVEVYRTRFRPMLQTLPDGQERITMKLVVDKASDKVIGLHMVGGDAAEIVQGFAVAMTAGATKAQFDATVALHPSAAEEFVTMYTPVGG